MSESKPTPPPTRDSPPRAEESTSAESTAGAAAAARTPGSVPAKIGRYEIRGILGEGGFGRVYRGFDPELHRDVAIKVPHVSALTRDLRERFLREARAAATIHHPNVCPIHDVGTDGDVPFIVMHFIEGGTLDCLLKRRNKPFSGPHAAAIVRKIALGIATAHERGVLHRDLKPANVLWDEAHREVLVTDFGLARIGGAAQISRTGDVLGTPAYMSPEQARGRQEEIGPLTDVYSLGVILYRMITGKVPFDGSVIEVLAQAQFDEARPPSSVLPGLDSRLDGICLKAMARNAEQRFVSARELAGALADYIRATETWRTGTSNSLPAARPLELPDDASDAHGDVPTTSGEPESPARGEAGTGSKPPRPVPTSSRNRPGPLPAVKVPVRILVLSLVAIVCTGLCGGLGVRYVFFRDQPDPEKTLDPGSDEPRPGEIRQVEIAPDVTMTFCWIPSGECQLGSPKSERDEVRTTLKLSEEPKWLQDEAEERRGTFRTNGFWMGKYELTTAQWATVMKATPSGSQFPVDGTSWDTCQKFLKQANAHGGVLKEFGKGGRFALPHEDQWEYACRGGLGNQRPFYWGSTLNGTEANCAGNSPFGTTKPGPFLNRTCSVDDTSNGNYPVHPWGLCHVHGNVYELCHSMHGQTSERAARGGSWYHNGERSRAARVFQVPSDKGFSDVGFRLILSSD